MSEERNGDKMKAKFYIYEHCGNLIEMINSSGQNIVCCGDKMKEIEVKTKEEKWEKHLPEVTRNDKVLLVNVGKIDHPMTENHYIEWIYLETEKGSQRKELKPGEKPSVIFTIADDKPLRVYAYCNLHGLWMTEL